MTCSSAVSLRWLGDHSRRLQPNGGLQQCAFILGCVVSVDTGEITATQTEDLASRQLVETLWENRCAAMAVQRSI